MRIPSIGLSFVLLLSASSGRALENPNDQAEVDEEFTTEEIDNVESGIRTYDYDYDYDYNPPGHHGHYKYRVIKAGPIWNNWDAQYKCPQVCSSQGGWWTGEWWTTVYNKMSVCECAVR